MTFLPKKIIIFKIRAIFENSEKDGNCDIDITAPINLLHGKAINKRYSLRTYRILELE